MSHFLLPAKNGEITYLEKKSRFVSQLFRIESEAEAQTYLDQAKKTFPKANHHCFAWQLGEHHESQRQSDAGEPQGTAGVPILSVLNEMEIHNTIIIVNRFFGGIKLGVGGLIRAYRKSATEVLHEVGLVQRVIQQEIDLTLNYSQLATLQYWLEKNKLPILKTTYAQQVQLSTSCPLTEVTATIQGLTNLFSGQIVPALGPTIATEIPYKV